jgi:hypothetical protein
VTYERATEKGGCSRGGFDACNCCLRRLRRRDDGKATHPTASTGPEWTTQPGCDEVSVAGLRSEGQTRALFGASHDEFLFSLKPLALFVRHVYEINGKPIRVNLAQLVEGCEERRHIMGAATLALPPE